MSDDRDVTSDHDETSSEGSQSSIELPEALAIGREKRQNAGNRLREMLNKELEREDVFAEEADDADFDSDQDKQSDLESEISSSSDGPAPQQQQQDDEGERALREQEKTARRVAKRKAQQQHQVKKEARPAKRARVRAPAQPVLYAGEKRSSARSHAVRVADEVERRLTEDAKRAKTPIAREEVVPLTQAERLAEAKLTEKRNVDSLNSLVRDEEERKAAQRALALRKRVPAPTVRQISRASGTSIVFEHVEVEDPVAMLVPHQPTERPPRWTCAFTGKPAKYHDPATGVYYSDAIAYAGIKRITAHEFAWSGELSTFLEPS